MEIILERCVAEIEVRKVVFLTDIAVESDFRVWICWIWLGDIVCLSIGGRGLQDGGEWGVLIRLELN